MADLEKNNTDMVECEKRQEMETFLQSEEFERDDFKQQNQDRYNNNKRLHDSYIKDIQELPLEYIENRITPSREKSNSPNRMIEPCSELRHHAPADTGVEKPKK